MRSPFARIFGRRPGSEPPSHRADPHHARPFVLLESEKKVPLTAEVEEELLGQRTVQQAIAGREVLVWTFWNCRFESSAVVPSDMQESRQVEADIRTFFPSLELVRLEYRTVFTLGSGANRSRYRVTVCTVRDRTG